MPAVCVFFGVAFPPAIHAAAYDLVVVVVTDFHEVICDVVLFGAVAVYLVQCVGGGQESGSVHDGVSLIEIKVSSVQHFCYLPLPYCMVFNYITKVVVCQQQELCYLGLSLPGVLLVPLFYLDYMIPCSMVCVKHFF